MALPTFLIIGAMKCGTTSLYHYLDVHPQIGMSRKKELNFFSNHWHFGKNWYGNQFPSDKKVRGDASPSYTKFPMAPEAPERMHQTVPDAKLIYLIRDPLQRTLSHYMHHVRKRKERRSFDEAVESEDSPYVSASKYFMQIERYLEFYPKESIKITLFEDLVNQKRETLRDLFKFINADPSFESPEFDKVYNQGATKNVKAEYVEKMEQRFYLKPLLRWIPKRLQEERIQTPIPSQQTKDKLCLRLKEDFLKLKKWTGYSFLEWESMRGC
jgi:hypothetical protein